MIDIHHHLLHGVDDGPQDLETSIAMVRMAVENGTTHIVATPHADLRFSYDRAAHEERLQKFREALPADLASRITLGLGCDFHLTYDNIQAAKKDPAYYSINGKGYLMVELPDEGISRNTAEVLYELRVAGMTPVLTHPERNLTIQRNLNMLKPWLEGGLLVQVTAGALTGVFSDKAKKTALDLMDRNWVHFISSDAHSTGRRNPQLNEAYQFVKHTYGEVIAKRLLIDNPLAAFEGRPLGPQPEPLGLYEELEPKPWWQRLFGR